MLDMFTMSGLHLAHSGLADSDFVVAAWWWELKADADFSVAHEFDWKTAVTTSQKTSKNPLLWTDFKLN